MTDKTTHKPGCEALGGYGHGIGPCSCSEAQPEALELADRLIGNAEIDECEGCNPLVIALERSAAAELRRLHAEIQQLKAQLSAWQAAPEGWRLVPVEPDSNMKRAAQKALMDHSPHSEWLEEEWPDGLRMWNAMLSAAPPPHEREPLSIKKINELEAESGLDHYELVRLVERAHGIGATNDNP